MLSGSISAAGAAKVEAGTAAAGVTSTVGAATTSGSGAATGVSMAEFGAEAPEDCPLRWSSLMRDSEPMSRWRSSSFSWLILRSSTTTSSRKSSTSSWS